MMGVQMLDFTANIKKVISEGLQTHIILLMMLSGNDIPDLLSLAIILIIGQSDGVENEKNTKNRKTGPHLWKQIARDGQGMEINSIGVNWSSNHLASNCIIRYSIVDVPTFYNYFSKTHNRQKSPIWGPGRSGRVSHGTGFAHLGGVKAAETHNPHHFLLVMCAIFGPTYSFGHYFGGSR
jgi:hypothetical protein